MVLFGERPQTSITVKINQLAEPGRNKEVDNTIELYLSDVLEFIRLQPGSGAAEAARAIRKKIKYGSSVEEQLRALSILELLVLNAGPSIGPAIARDDKLLDVLKGIISGNGKTGMNTPYDKQITTRARELAVGWKSELKDLEGYKYLATIWKNIPKQARHSRRERSSGRPPESDFVRQRTPSPSPELRKPPPRPTTTSPYQRNEIKQGFSNNSSSKKSKRKVKGKKGVVYADTEYEIPQLNYKVEAPKIRSLIASSVTHTTNLSNVLVTLQAGVSPLDDPKAVKEFETCRKIRRKVLRYLQYVGAGDANNKSEDVLRMDEEFLGSLISANESLVAVFKKFDFACGYEDNTAPQYDDEDSDESYYTEESSDEGEGSGSETDSLSQKLNNTTLEGSSSQMLGKKSPPPRPQKPPALNGANTGIPSAPSTDTLQSDPFQDSNEVSNNKSVYL